MPVVMAHAKAIAAALAAVLAAVVPALTTGVPLGFAGWVNVVVLAAGAFHVYNAQNTPAWNYAKMVAAVVSAGAVILSSALSDGGVSTTEWVQVAIAVIGAFAVYEVPNAPRAAGTTTRGRHERPEPGTEPPV